MFEMVPSPAESSSFADGTNVLVGTDCHYVEFQTTDWYLPQGSNATPRWREKIKRVQNQFELLARNHRPQPCVLIQHRVPALGDMPDPYILFEGQHNLISGGSGLDRELSPLTNTEGQQLFSPFPIKDATGQTLGSDGLGLAIRFGLSRMHYLCRGANYVHETRPPAGPQLGDVARDASGVLFGLPAQVSKVIWANWISGFRRRISEHIWFDALFELAWQSREGSSLIADRYAWHDTLSVKLEGSGLFPRISKAWLEFVPNSIPHEYGHPLCFYSRIDDIARASVSMIDVLLELADISESTASNRKAESREEGRSMTAEQIPSSNQVFISYSHKDNKFLEDFLAHLKPFVRTGVKAWSDKQIAPGSQWQQEIKTALSEAKVAVLLVSPQFLASDFIHDHELAPLLREAEAGGVTILWILIRACSYEETELVNFQALVSPPEKPLAEMKAERDAAWKRICQEIKKAATRAR